MWAYQLSEPRRMERVEVTPPEADDLGPGQVLLRLRIGGVCGSDVPKFTGAVGAQDDDQPGPGFPLHEVVGDVVASTSRVHAVGSRVVGYADGARGLRELFVNGASSLYPLPSDLDDGEAIVAQPLATVLSAAARLPEVRGRRVAVLGLGPIGLLFADLARSLGAAHVIGVDPVDRASVAARYGIDELVTSTARAWVERMVPAEAPDICVEAVGHQEETMVDAVRAAAPGGHVLAFGVVDSEDYLLPFRTLFRKNLTLTAGTTWDWRRYLDLAVRRLTARPLPDGYVTDLLGVEHAQRAYERAAQPAADRLKVALVP